MQEITKIKETVAGIEPEESESSDQTSLQPWLKQFLEAPSSVLTQPEHRIVLREVAREWATALESEEIEIEAKDMGTLFESEEAQKQQFKAVLAAKCNKFANEVWAFQKDLKPEVENLRESLENTKQALDLQTKTKKFMVQKVSKIPTQQEASLKAIDSAAKKLSDSLEEYEHWLQAGKEYPDYMIDCLEEFLKQKTEKLKDNQALSTSISWSTIGEGSEMENQSNVWPSSLRNEIEIQYYESSGEVLDFEVLWRKKDKFKNEGTQEYTFKQETESYEVEPTHLKVKRADIGFIQYCISGSGKQFFLVFLDQERKTLVDIGKKGANKVQEISMEGKELVGINVRRRQQNELYTVSIAIGSCDKQKEK